MMFTRENPYEPPSGDGLSGRHERRWSECLWSVATTFGASMVELSLFASVPWDGTITLYDIPDRSHILSALISFGLAIASGVSLYASLSMSQPHLRVTLLAAIGLVAIGFLCCADWPIAAYYVYFDLANVLAVYIAMGLMPSLLIALVPLRKRKFWHAFVPYATLTVMAIYVALRAS